LARFHHLFVFLISFLKKKKIILFYHIIELVVMFVAPLVSYAPHTKYAFAPFLFCFVFVCETKIEAKAKVEARRKTRQK
jgi:hypothetical protein